MNNRYRSLEQRYQTQDARVRALMGLEQPANPKHAELRQALTEIAPELGVLFDSGNFKGLQKVLQLVNSGQLDQVVESGDAGWVRHGFSMSNLAVDQYAKAVGVEGDKLPPTALRRIARELQGFIGDEDSGARLRRYEMGDPKLISEFIEDLTGFYVAPVRAQQTQHGAQLANQNRRLPSAGARGAVPPQGGVTKKSREEVSAAARQFVLDNQGG